MNRPVASLSRSRLTLACLLLLVSFLAFHASAITLTGSNGRAVEFAGLKDATPKGITAQVVADGPIIGIPWEKLDLGALENEHPRIHAAYLATLKGETVALNAGSFDDGSEKKMEPEQPRARFPGWLDVESGGITFAMQLPQGEPRAILFLSVGDQGESLKYFTGFDPGTGPFGELQKEENVVLMSYSIDYRDGDPRKMPDVAFADKGLAEKALAAVSSIATRENRPELTRLPFLVHGSERFGATVGYSFVQAKPEIVLAATLLKGAFYRADPTDASVEVPILFLYGEYSNNAELWNTEHDVKSALARSSEWSANWTGAREFRGNGDMNQATEHLAKLYLREMLSLRLNESPEEAESGPQGRIQPLDRSKGYFGSFEDFSYEKIEDIEAKAGEGQTFLPTLGMAKLWKQYGEGTLELP